MQIGRLAQLACLAVAITHCGPLGERGSTLRNLTVVVGADDHNTDVIRRTLEHTADLPLRIRGAQIPRIVEHPATFSDVSSTLSRARREYIDADFAQCLHDVGEIHVNELLAANRRDLAARILFWRIACQVGANDAVEAARSSRQLAVYGLDVPPDVEAASPDVEAAIATAQHAVESEPRTELRLTNTSISPAFSIDGRAIACSSPCVIDLAPGDHVVHVEADGETPIDTTVRAEGTRVEQTIVTTSAPPEMAAQQWAARYVGTAFIDAERSLRLLSHAVRARDVVLLNVDPSARGLRLRAAYAIDGDIHARAERISQPDHLGLESRALLRELLVRSGTVTEHPLYRNAIFWVAIVGATAAAAVITALLVQPPPTRTEVTF